MSERIRTIYKRFAVVFLSLFRQQYIYIYVYIYKYIYITLILSYTFVFYYNSSFFKGLDHITWLL